MQRLLLDAGCSLAVAHAHLGNLFVNYECCASIMLSAILVTQPESPFSYSILFEILLEKRLSG
jgi:hypothetical protein